MKYCKMILGILFSTGVSAQTAEAILDLVDQNMSSENRIVESTMIIHGRRVSRTITLKSWSVGSERAFTEYLSPAREQGTKMLKLEDQLWLYSPSTDRTIQIAGHMLRQSVMGSDLSYEDLMEDRKLTEVYDAEVAGEETLEGRNTWVLELTAKVDDVAYYSRKEWIDRERYVPLREELYAKSGQLLKRTDLKDVKMIQGRWFPTTMVFKDMLKDGEGTEYVINSIQFNQQIPEYIFTKAALKQ
ncbi:MAG: outer membrane lipoprotein-sorting protein [Bacteroidales bacterium]|nr:outer membrane lipoprotein-sorting protein [Bacteroidales bacterium]